MAKHLKTGEQGEKLAAGFLTGKGWIILEKNWKFGQKEIDIIARDKDEIVIVEVKTRSTDYFGDPEEAVTIKKQEYLIEAAEEYLELNDLDEEVRFDVISIVLKNGNARINHIENAFYPLF